MSCEAEFGNINTVLLVMNLVLTAVTTTMLGLRCKLWRTNAGCFASCRPRNSSPSPANNDDKSPIKLKQVVVVKQ